jgi:hypothetical protein
MAKLVGADDQVENQNDFKGDEDVMQNCHVKSGEIVSVGKITAIVEPFHL